MAVSGSFENSAKEKGDLTAWWQPAVAMFFKLSVWIVAPIIVSLYLGKWLDKEFNSAPWLFLLCMAVAFLVSMTGLIFNTLAEYKKIEEASKKKNPK